MKISEFIKNRDKFEVDLTYQRQEGVWNNQDKQCLIDTIIKGEPMPIIFLNYKTSEKKYYIIDGQQRLSVIRDFFDNKIKLSKIFSAEELDGKKYLDLDEENRENFWEYDFPVKIMKDYDDEKVRLIFSRLQRGRPLNLGERINAKPGDIIIAIRKLAEHEFLTKSTGFSKNRYTLYEDVTRLMFYEVYKEKVISVTTINEFLEEYKNKVVIGSEIYCKIENILNILLKCFPSNPGNYAHLEKHTWLLTIYTVISNLKSQYSFINKELEIGDFVKEFHSKVYSPDWRQSETDYAKFYDSVRGGWSEKLIKIRRDIMKKHLLEEVEIRDLDINRQISNEEKIAIFSTKNKCQECDKVFKDYKEPEYHHIELYSEGGKTAIDNIIPLCKECHNKIHSTKNVEIETLGEEDLEGLEIVPEE